MEFVDIIIDGIPYEKINYFAREILQIKPSNVLDSHFFNKIVGDFNYYNELDLQQYLLFNETCFIKLSELLLNISYHDILIIFTSEEETVSINLNIPLEQFEFYQRDSLINHLKTILLDNNLKKIIFGLSDVSDDDAYVQITHNTIIINENFDFYQH
jgi:hypothetical protein